MRARFIDFSSVFLAADVCLSSREFWNDYRILGPRRFYRVWQHELFRLKEEYFEKPWFRITHDPGDPAWSDLLQAYMSPAPGIYLQDFSEVFFNREAWEENPLPKTASVVGILENCGLQGILLVRLASPETLQKVFWRLRAMGMRQYPQRYFCRFEGGISHFWREQNVLMVDVV